MKKLLILTKRGVEYWLDVQPEEGAVASINLGTKFGPIVTQALETSLIQQNKEWLAEVEAPVECLPPTIEKELEHLINKHSQERASNTPDFILAQYLQECLATFANATKARDKWYGTLNADRFRARRGM